MTERVYDRAGRKNTQNAERTGLKSGRKRRKFKGRILPQQGLAASQPSAVQESAIALPTSTTMAVDGSKYLVYSGRQSTDTTIVCSNGSSSSNKGSRKTSNKKTLKRPIYATSKSSVTLTEESVAGKASAHTAAESQEGSNRKTTEKRKAKREGEGSVRPTVARIKEKPPRFTHPRLNAVLSRLRRSWLSPGDDLYEAALQRSYRGMKHLPRQDLPPSVHRRFIRSFEGLNDAGLFLYDTVQAGGKRLSRTFVTRTLVGDAGITYKYLGLRLFAHPWNAPGDFRAGPGDSLANALSDPCLADLFCVVTSVENESGVGDTLQRVRDLSEWMRARAEGLLDEQKRQGSGEGGGRRGTELSASAGQGSCAFNLTLVNRMESTASKRDLKPDPLFDMGKCSVSWHADSCLEDFSTIGVYHCTEPAVPEPDWGIALRVSQEACEGGGERSGPQDAPTSKRKRKRGEHGLTGAGALEAEGNEVLTPPLLVPLQSGDAYFLLDDFNHFHEHAVVSGHSTLRYSSTHRVAAVDGNTFSYVQKRCEEVLAGSRGRTDPGGGGDPTAESRRKILDVAQVRAEQSLLTELEAEWLNQFWVQGRRHASLHPWWRGPMALVLATWRELERRTAVAVGRLLSLKRPTSSSSGGGSERGPESAAVAKAFDTVLRALEERRESRDKWASRFSDPAYRSLPSDCAPVVPDLWSRKHSDLVREEEPCSEEGGAVAPLPEALAPVISRLRECYKEAFRAACGGKKASSAKAIASGAASNWELFRAASRPRNGGERREQHNGVVDRKSSNGDASRSTTVGSSQAGSARGKRKKGKSNKRRRHPV